MSPLMVQPLRFKSQLLSGCRIAGRNWIKILIILSLFLSLFYAHFVANKMNILIYFRKVPKTTYYVEVNPFTFNATNIMLKPSKALCRIYEQQFSQHAAAPFLPTYQNHRLILKFSLSSIATHLYGNVNSFQGSSRGLRVACLEKRGNKTTFQQSFDLTLRFNVQKVNMQAMHFTLDSRTEAEPSLIISTVPANKRTDLVTHIIVHVNRIFSMDTVFSFTYQWLDSDVLNFFHWPQWPLTKSCANRILNDLIQNHTVNPQRHFSCSITSILTHSTSRQLFTDEQIAISDWLDIQYRATITDSFSTENPLSDLLSSTTRTRRLIPFEVASNPKVCSAEFHSWISKYQDWHANVSSSISDPRLTFEQQRDRIVDQNVRFMLYEKNPSGVADRIVHLMTTYLIAILTNRLFVFDADWPEFSHVMLASLNYERESVIPWFRRLDRLNKYLSRNNTKYLTSGHYKFSFDRLRRDYDYDRQFPERILTFRAHTGGIVHMMMSETSVFRKFLTEDLRMRADNMFGCLYHSLFLYRLSELIEITSADHSNDSLQQEQLGHSPQQLLLVLLSPAFYPIGVQVRTGDATMKGDNTKSWFKVATSENSLLESFRYFFNCARDLVDGNQTFLTDIKQVPIVFLLSDTVRLRRAALLRWKLPSSCLQSFGDECRNQTHALPVVANPNPVFHVAYTSQHLLAFRLAMFDTILFGLCEQHVISAESGFGSLGVFASLKQRNIYSLSIFRKGSCLGKNRDISLVDSSYQWSGI
jgi:hypothetical protein